MSLFVARLPSDELGSTRADESGDQRRGETHGRTPEFPPVVVAPWLGMGFGFVSQQEVRGASMPRRGISEAFYVMARSDGFAGEPSLPLPNVYISERRTEFQPFSSQRNSEVIPTCQKF